MAEDNHGWAIGWGFGGLFAGLLYGWPANCVSQTRFGAQRVEYDSGREMLGEIACVNVLGLPRAELDQLETFIGSVLFGVLLGMFYEVYLWWRRSQPPPATGAT
jgi:hypothetical protein